MVLPVGYWLTKWMMETKMVWESMGGVQAQCYDTNSIDNNDNKIWRKKAYYEY